MGSLHKYSVFQISNSEKSICLKYYDTLKMLVLLVCLVVLSFYVLYFSPVGFSTFTFKTKVFAPESPFSAPTETTYQFEGMYVGGVCVCACGCGCGCMFSSKSSSLLSFLWLSNSHNFIFFSSLGGWNKNCELTLSSNRNNLGHGENTEWLKICRRKIPMATSSSHTRIWGSI